MDDEIPERVEPDPGAREGIRALAPAERVWQVAAEPVPSRLDVIPAQWRMLPSWLRPALEREINTFGEILGNCDASIAAARAADDPRLEETLLKKRNGIMAAAEKILVFDPMSDKEIHGNAKRKRLHGRPNYKASRNTLILRHNCDDLMRAFTHGGWLGPPIRQRATHGQ